jgi:hypothetical protein
LQAVAHDTGAGPIKHLPLSSQDATAQVFQRRFYSCQPLFRRDHAAGGQIDLLLQVFEPALHGAPQMRFQPSEAGSGLNIPCADQFGRGGGRSRSLVCHVVGNGEIRFVANAADDGYGARDDRVGQDFFVERPKVLNAAAAAANDERIAFATGSRRLDSARQLFSRAGPLDGRGIDDGRQAGRPPFQCGGRRAAPQHAAK